MSAVWLNLMRTNALGGCMAAKRSQSDKGFAMIRQFAYSVSVAAALSGFMAVGVFAQTATSPANEVIGEPLPGDQSRQPTLSLAELPEVGAPDLTHSTRSVAAPVFESFDVPLPPRRTVAVAPKPQVKAKKVVSAPLARVARTTDTVPLSQVAMMRPMPKVWITVGSGF